MSSLQIGLVGAGAVGSLLAASLAHRGIPFHWVVRNELRRDSLPTLRTIIGSDYREIDLSPVTVCSSIEELPAGLDWLITAVKSYDVDTVLSNRPEGVANILVIANGLLEGDYHLGLLYGGARLEPDVLTATARSRLLIGPIGAATDDSNTVARVLETPWMNVLPDPEIQSAQWHKLAMNCAINPLTALLDCRNGDLPAYGTMPLITAILNETGMFANAVLGDKWQYSPEDLLSDCLELIAGTAENSSSMREDFKAGRRTEISMLNCAVAARGAVLGLDCPLNHHLGDMLFLLANNGAL